MKLFDKTIFLSILVLVFSVLNIAINAQTASLTTSPYTQNFDTLANTGTNITWTNDSTIDGWQSNRTTYNSGTGSVNTGSLYSFGAAASNERALGSLASGGTGTIIYGACFTNNSGNNIGELTISYTGEQWRVGSSTNVNDGLTFQYQVGVNSVTAGGTWTAVTALDFVPPTTSPFDTAIDGNSAANRTNPSSTISNIFIPVGSDFCIRWSDTDSTGGDTGNAIDSFSLGFSPLLAANASIGGRVIDANGNGISKVQVKISGGGLSEPIFAVTNPFGYYNFEVPVGETYFVTVNSKNYTFSNPTRVINVNDNITDLNFTADER